MRPRPVGPAAVVVVVVVVGRKRIVELPPPVAGDADDDARVPLGVWLVGTLPRVAVGVPSAADAPGRDESPPVIGAAPVAVPDDVAPVSLGGVVVTTAMPTAIPTAMTMAAQTPRRANNRYATDDARRRGMDMSVLSFSRRF